MILDVISNIFGTFAAFVLGAAVCTLVEFMSEAEKQSAMSRVRGFCFSFLSLAAAVIATHATQLLMGKAGLAPLLHLDLAGTIHSANPWVMVAGYTLVPLLALFVYDVGYYVFHRLQHSVPFLWRYHAVHHSIEELNCFNSYHHVSEYFFRIPLLTIPVNLLFAISEPQVVVTATIVSALGKLTHANTRVGYGPFRFLVTEPRFHRVHHSLEERHWNCNFAFYFPVLDMLFRTAYWPAKDEYPRTGVDYLPEPRSLGAFLLPPRPLGRAEESLREPAGVTAA
jgi:sterol desaturase/sphingolipid hydroxylase (fatty acid hydroxylase superfamily)